MTFEGFSIAVFIVGGSCGAFLKRFTHFLRESRHRFPRSFLDGIA